MIFSSEKTERRVQVSTLWSLLDVESNKESAVTENNTSASSFIYLFLLINEPSSCRWIVGRDFPPQHSVAEGESSHHLQSVRNCRASTSLLSHSVSFPCCLKPSVVLECEAATLQKCLGDSQSSPSYRFATKSKRLDFISGSLNRHKHRWSALTALVCTRLTLSAPLFGCLRLSSFSQNFNVRQTGGHWPWSSQHWFDWMFLNLCSEHFLLRFAARHRVWQHWNMQRFCITANDLFISGWDINKYMLLTVSHKCLLSLGEAKSGTFLLSITKTRSTRIATKCELMIAPSWNVKMWNVLNPQVDSLLPALHATLRLVARSIIYFWFSLWILSSCFWLAEIIFFNIYCNDLTAFVRSTLRAFM